MNTPAHLAASLLVWRHEPGWRGAAATTFGAALPDLPMFGFYVWQKTIGSPETQIWGDLYFRDGWQLFFDLFNSIPLAALVALFCFWRRLPLGVLIASSAALHMLCDLPVHNDDAHRHFLPANWRFHSPLSYWDPEHYGRYFMPLEFLGAMAASFWVATHGRHRPMRWIAGFNFGFYVFILVAVFGWIAYGSLLSGLHDAGRAG